MMPGQGTVGEVCEHQAALTSGEHAEGKEVVQPQMPGLRARVRFLVYSVMLGMNSKPHVCQQVFYYRTTS